MADTTPTTPKPKRALPYLASLLATPPYVLSAVRVTIYPIVVMTSLTLPSIVSSKKWHTY